MTLRLAAAALLLLAACTSARTPATEPWVEFRLARLFPPHGAVRGEISSTGAVHVEALGTDDARRVAFEKQLRPVERGALREAIAEHRARFGQNAAVRNGASDADELTIRVHENGELILSFRLAATCADEDGAAYDLWNAIMRAVDAPEHDMRDHMIRCE